MDRSYRFFGSALGAALALASEAAQAQTIPYDDYSFRLAGEEVGAAGPAVATGGDVNGDGWDELLVGEAQGGLPDESGAAYLQCDTGPGPETEHPAVDVTFVGENPGDRFGAAVSLKGDYDGDGYADIAIGAPGFDGTGTDSGKVYVWYGKVDFCSIAGIAIDADMADEQIIASDAPILASDGLGSSLTGEADVDHDGTSDLAVGAPGNDFNGTDSGVVMIWKGDGGFGPLFDFAIFGEGSGSGFGASVADAGFVDSSDQRALVVGAPGYAGKGAAYLVLDPTPSCLGPVCLAAASYVSVRFDGQKAGDKAGYSVAGLGRFDGDGFDDVAVGAPYFDLTGKSDAGAVYVIPGNSAYAPGQAYSIKPVSQSYRGAAANARVGWSVAGLGDVAGSAAEDLAIGAPWQGSGKVFVRTGVSVLTPGATASLGSGGIQVVGLPGYRNVGWSIDGRGLEPLGLPGYGVAIGALWTDAMRNVAAIF